MSRVQGLDFGLTYIAVFKQDATDNKICGQDHDKSRQTKRTPRKYLL